MHGGWTSTRRGEKSVTRGRNRALSWNFPKTRLTFLPTCTYIHNDQREENVEREIYMSLQGVKGFGTRDDMTNKMDLRSLKFHRIDLLRLEACRPTVAFWPAVKFQSIELRRERWNLSNKFRGFDQLRRPRFWKPIAKFHRFCFLL